MFLLHLFFIFITPILSSCIEKIYYIVPMHAHHILKHCCCHPCPLMDVVHKYLKHEHAGAVRCGETILYRNIC